MYSYGETSERRLRSCCMTLQLIMTEALNMGLCDITIIDGFRNQRRQDEYYRKGKSRAKWPDGKHNVWKSEAVDAAPYVNGKASSDVRHCCFLAGVVQTAAKKLGYLVRWGGNWDMDGEVMTDQDFQDLWHYELIGRIKDGSVIPIG